MRVRWRGGDRRDEVLRFSRRLWGIVWALGVLAAVVVAMALWQHPAHVPQYDEAALRWGPSTERVATGLDVERPDTRTVCVSARDGGARVGVVLPSSWSATVPGPVRRALGDQGVRLHDRESGTSFDGEQSWPAMGRFLDPDDAADARVIAEWTSRCGGADRYAAVSPYGVLGG